MVKRSQYIRIKNPLPKHADGRGVGVKNRENLPTSKMDGPLAILINEVDTCSLQGKDEENIRVTSEYCYFNKFSLFFYFPMSF